MAKKSYPALEKARAAKAAKAAERREAVEERFNPVVRGPATLRSQPGGTEDYPRQQPPLRRPSTDPLGKALNAVERAAARRQAELGPGYGPMQAYPDDEIDDGEPLRGAPRAVQRKPGGLGIKAAPRSTVGRREAPGTEERRVMLSPSGRVMVRGRDGKMLTRTNVGSSDKFFIPPEIIPDGWSYQGIAVSVTGQPQSTVSFQNNGWTPVPASRHDGMFMPVGHDGPIVIDGLMLCERPIELTLEARKEETDAARNLIRTQNEQFTPRLPDARRHPETQMRARRTIEGLPPDVPMPQYRYGVDEGA